MQKVSRICIREGTNDRNGPQTIGIHLPKTHTECTTRLQRIIFDVSQYAPRVIYKKGKDIPIADTMSRDCEQSNIINPPEEDFQVCVVLAASKTATEEIRQHTRQDRQLQELIKYVQEGFPENIRSLPHHIKPYCGKVIGVFVSAFPGQFSAR
uniref:Uncharacterized protein n=1 Tax=Photinus pyralis TaxID=7054 RepID=A0A1Y1JYS1_PHOPY